jgi:hypothetical protein
MSEPQRDLLWQHYEMLVDLYKHYLDVALKFNAFYYFITGAILSYYFAESSRNPMMRWSLLFPIFMSVAFALFFFYAATLHSNARKEVARVAQILGLQVWPDVGVLNKVLVIFAVLYLLVASGIGYLFYATGR